MKKPRFERSDIYEIGKQVFAVRGGDGEYSIYRLYRKQWQLIDSSCETSTGADAMVLHYAKHSQHLDVPDLQKWLENRKAGK